MGNVGSTSGNGSRRRHRSRRSRQAPLPQPDMVNRYVYPAATAPYPTPGYYQYPAGYYPPPGTVGPPLPAPYDDHHHRVPNGNWAARQGLHPCGPAMGPPAPCVEYQMAATIRNDVNLKKETIKFVGDEEMPGKYLLEFTFDAATDGSIAILYFAKEGEDGNLAPTKESLLPAVKVNFQQGLGQKFRQPSGTGIDFSAFEGTELLKETDTGVFPLAVKAESPAPAQTGADGNLIPGSTNSQITQAVFEKEKDEYRVKVVKQILWVNGSRYELQEIYGIGQTVEGDFDGSDPGKECVICLSEPRDTAVLPCRHMCMCNGCAKVLRYRTNRCPICRQPVDRLLEINFANFPQVNAD